MQTIMCRSVLIMLFVLVSFSNSVLAQTENWRALLPDNKLTDVFYFDGAFYSVGESANPIPPAGSIGLLSKISENGTIEWTKEFHFYTNTLARSLSVNETGIYVAGNGFIANFSLSGDLIWSLLRQDFELENLPTSINLSSLTQDSNGLYAAGSYHDGRNQSILLHIAFNGHFHWVQKIASKVSGGITGLAINDGVLYAVANQSLYKYRANDGYQLQETPTDFTTRDIIYSSDAIYLTGSTSNFQGSGGYSELIAKYNLNTDRLWMLPSHPEKGGWGVQIAADENNLYTFSKLNQDSNNHNLHLDRYDLEGNLEQEWNVPNTSIDQDYEPKFLLKVNKNLHIGGVYYPLTGYVAEIAGFDGSETSHQGATALVRTLDDVNQDGHQEIAVLVKETSNTGVHPTKVQIKSLGSQSLNYDIGFETTSDISDFKVIPDLNANLAPELAILNLDASTIEIRDSLTGSLVSNIQYNQGVKGIKLLALPDMNNNGSYDLGLLGQRKSTAGVFVEIRDGLGGQLLNTVSFNANFSPIDLTLIKDVDNDGSPEIGVLSIDSDNQTSKIEIRNLSGALLRNLWPGKRFNTLQLVTLPAAPLIEPNEATIVGVLQTKTIGEGTRVKFMDPADGTEIQNIGFNWNYRPIKVLTMENPSILSADLGLLGIGLEIVNGTEKQTQKIEIRDIDTALLGKNLWLSKKVTPLDFSIVPDINGNLFPETATLVDEDSQPKVIVTDSDSGTIIEILEFVYY